MNFIENILNAFRLNPNRDDDYYDDGEFRDEDDEVEEPAPRRKSAKAKREEMENDYYREEAPKKAKTSQSKITPMRQPVAKKSSISVGGMEVRAFKPTTVEESREITDTLLSGRTLILNLEGLDVDVAQRIIDFSLGSCYAIQGKWQKISHYIFIITPNEVDLTGDFLDALNEVYDGPFNTGI